MKTDRKTIAEPSWSKDFILPHKSFVQIGEKLTDLSLKIQWMIFSKLLQTFLRQFSTDLAEILDGGTEFLEEGGSAIVFLIVFKIFRMFPNFPEI